MAKQKKFLALLEKYESRFEQSGFLVGDVFKFNDGYKSHEGYKNLNDNVKDVIDSYVDSDMHIRVTAVDEDGTITIAQDHGGGRHVGKVTIPSNMGERIDFGNNLPPLPDALRRDDKVQIKPVEVPPLPENPTDVKDGDPIKAEEDEEEAAKKKQGTEFYL